ncbi:hypothetical protein [Aporhodopirellula aestuarii]|uniref:Phage tail protein n=1 Tax=Aporhodopirellula aestuarii TaxID=2950107 RepID=A0ABT0UA92_9BACT|nr:hypothetical protein [Aporhodopirellula aestuarii]MCM2373918.1 hypothetical protein [Aporhodopirellula aestuarii]
MATLNLDAGTINPVVGEQQVWIKANWSDPFTLEPRLMVEECVWAMPPSMDSATLRWRFGEVVTPGATVKTTVPPIDIRGYYVLILQYSNEGSLLAWLGYADAPIVTDMVDLVGEAHGGEQAVPCFGLDRALQYAFINTVAHLNPAVDPEDKWLRKYHGGTFNGGLTGNRTKDKVDLTSDFNPEKAYVFDDPQADDSQWWSTRDVFEHLIRFHLPTNVAGEVTLPWNFRNEGILPTWDRPFLETDGRSLWDCLTELLSPERMLAWSVRPTLVMGTVPSITEIAIYAHSQAPSAIVIPDLTVIAPNTDTLAIVASTDSMTDIQVQADDSDVVDQVVVQGPREIGVATFDWFQWDRAWGVGDLNSYNVAFSTLPGWAAQSLSRKRELNERFRSQGRYADLYSHLPIWSDWDGTTGVFPVFADNRDEESDEPVYVPYLGHAEILEDLPLYAGVDYTGDLDDVDESKGRKRLPILAFISKPADPFRYETLQDATTVSGGFRSNPPNMLPFSVEILPDNSKGAGFRVAVSGAPKHALWPTMFTPNDADPEKTNPDVWGNYDGNTMNITAAMRGDRRPTVWYPTSPSSDMIRQRFIRLEHSALQLVHIAANTRLGLDDNDIPTSSNGGILRDPMQMLTALARLAGESMTVPRVHFWMSTGRLVRVIPGQMITTANGSTVNAIVTEVRLSTPIVESDSPPPVRVQVIAQTNPVDLIAMMGRKPDLEEELHGSGVTR